MKFDRIVGSLIRHVVMRNSRPYEQVLREIKARGDIWMVSQGEYIAWWLKRENATLEVTVSDGMCRAYTSLENGVIEKWPGEFISSSAVPCPETKLSGEVWITIDSTLEKKDLLIEILRREGILNFRVAAEGEFMLSRQEMAPVLEQIHPAFHEWQGQFLADHVRAVRQIVAKKLAAKHLPLLRIWYHPRVNGTIPRAVFSPRHDVDRAITNLAYVRGLEVRYGASSTLYVRAFGLFYGDKEIKEVAASPWCSEIALHGEFATNARQYGDEFKAACAEKAHLEKLVGHPVIGVSIHGGELTNNRSENTADVIQKAQFLYDTTPASQDCFPYRPVVREQLSNSYCLVHNLGDISITANREYRREFYEQVIAKMDEIYEQNGVFVMMLHPVYFGFLAYLSHPRNWIPFVRSLPGFLRRLCRLRSNHRCPQ